jgi:hypothetical protein
MCDVMVTEPFSVDEVSVFAERLAVMSFAPADYIERKGLAAHKVVTYRYLIAGSFAIMVWRGMIWRAIETRNSHQRHWNHL